MSDLAWHKAASVLRLTADKRASGWPDAFRIGELAWLQYPPEGAGEQRVSAKRRRVAFEAAVNEAIDNGTIQADSTVEQRTAEMVTGVRNPINCNGPRDTPRHQFMFRKRVQYELTVVRITRTAFARWWEQQREAPSEHLEAWLASGSQGQADETTEQRNQRVAAAYVDRQMSKADAMALVGTEDNLKRIAKDERLRRKAGAVLDGTMSMSEALLPNLKKENLDNAIAAEKKRRGIEDSEPTWCTPGAAGKPGIFGLVGGGAVARPTPTAAKPTRKAPKG